jgi:hypothetical protein
VLALSEEIIELTVRNTKNASAAFIKELMRRSAQYCLRNGGRNVLDRQPLDSALEEMLFIGGSLNAKVLGASAVQQDTIS